MFQCHVHFKSMLHNSNNNIFQFCASRRRNGSNTLERIFLLTLALFYQKTLLLKIDTYLAPVKTPTQSFQNSLHSASLSQNEIKDLMPSAACKLSSIYNLFMDSICLKREMVRSKRVCIGWINNETLDEIIVKHWMK